MKINWISEFRKLWGSVTKENNHFTTERIEGLIVSIIADSRQQGRMEMAEEIEKEINNNFGDGSERALVIIESTISGVSQTPALKNVSTIINNLKVK